MGYNCFGNDRQCNPGTHLVDGLWERPMQGTDGLLKVNHLTKTLTHHTLPSQGLLFRDLLTYQTLARVLRESGACLRHVLARPGG